MNKNRAEMVPPEEQDCYLCGGIPFVMLPEEEESGCCYDCGGIPFVMLPEEEESEEE